MKPLDGDPDAFAAWESHLAFRLFAERQDLALSVPEQIATRVGDRILSGALAPGEHLAEQELAAEFEVTRGPVREAIRLLEREGLVTFWPRRGAVVTELSVTELQDIYEIRAALVDLVASKCATMDPSGLVPAMRAGLERLESLVEAPGGGDAYADTVYRLLLIKARFCGNRRLQTLLTTLSLQTLRYFRIGLASAERRRRSIAFWRRSVTALERGDVEGMRAVMHEAMADGSRDIQRSISEPKGTVGRT